MAGSRGGCPPRRRYGLHRTLTWVDRRGWVFYRNRERKAPLPMGILEEIYHPAIEHLVVELGEEAIRADQEESGQGDPEN